MSEHEILIDFDKKCKTCFSYGACPNGLCLKCSAKVLLARMRESRKRAAEKPEEYPDGSKSG